MSGLIGHRGLLLAGPAAPPSGGSDDFSTNTLALYTQSGGASWSIGSGLLQGSGGSQATLTRNSISLADIRATLDITTAQDAGVVARWTDANNHYIATIHDASSTTSIPNRVQLYAKVAGGFTQLGSTGVISFTRGTPHTYALVISGTSIVVEFDGVPVISVTDGSLSSAGSAGPRVSNGGGYTGLIEVDKFTWA